MLNCLQRGFTLFASCSSGGAREGREDEAIVLPEGARGEPFLVLAGPVAPQGFLGAPIFPASCVSQLLLRSDVELHPHRGGELAQASGVPRNSIVGLEEGTASDSKQVSRRARREAR